MAMSTDSELKKILLREQDLRFVTDTLTQYLGQKAKEREFYAKERAVERKEEKALAAKGLERKEYTYYDEEAGKEVKAYLTDDERAALGVTSKEGPAGAGKLPETEEYYFNIPPRTEWDRGMEDLLSGYYIDENIKNKGGTYKVSLNESELSKFTPYFSQVDKPTTTTAPLTSTQMKSGLIESINNRLDDTSIGARKKKELRKIKADIESMTTDIDDSTYKDYETKIGAKYDTGKLSQKQKQYRNTARTHKNKRNNIASRYRNMQTNTILNVMDWSIPDKRESIKAYGEEQKYDIMTVYPEMTGIKIYTTQYTDDGLEVLGSDTAFVEWQLDVEKSTKISDEKKKEFLSWTKEEFMKAMQENQDKNDYEENPGTPYFIIIDEPQIPPSILDLISKDKD